MITTKFIKAARHVLRSRMTKKAKIVLSTNELTPEELAAMIEFMDAADTGKDLRDYGRNFKDKNRNKYLNSGAQGLKDLYDDYRSWMTDLNIDGDSDWDRIGEATKTLRQLYKRRFKSLPKMRGPWD